MATKKLQGMRVAVLAADGFEQVEVTRPVAALEDEGAVVDIISLRPGKIMGMNHLLPGKRVAVDRTIHTADAADYDALFLPGGLVSPDSLRQSEAVIDFVRAFDRAGKPIAAICHGPWVLISAGLASGRMLTSWPGMRDDVVNAGGVWQDQAVVRDSLWVTSRGPHDLPQFNEAMIELYAERMPVARPAEKPARNVHVGRWIAGGAALAAAILVIRRAAA
jgi:protease I